MMVWPFLVIVFGEGVLTPGFPPESDILEEGIKDRVCT